MSVSFLHKPTFPEFELVDENAHFLVVGKAAGVISQGAQADHNLLAAIERHLMQRVLPVHRLDSGTSGLMVLAKHSEAARLLSSAFANRQVEKRYIALSDRKPIKKQGKVNGDMVKARNGCWRLARTQDNPAATVFQSVGALDGPRLFLLKPITGKTHQLRVALKAISAPILGDNRYGGTPSDRLYLHAYQLSFSYQGIDYRYRLRPNQGLYFQHLNTVELDLLESKF